VKRLLIGGCMQPADPLYDALAEVHVPDACKALKGSYHVGCMFPGAENFDPAAKQPGRCVYLTKGCTDSNALNYNSEARIDEGCILPSYGCTVQGGTNAATPTAYTGVDSGTPNYQTLTVGDPGRFVGQVTYPSYPSVVQTDANANTLDGSCVVAIEGCMDSNSPNYDPKATFNTNTWCIPHTPGCMVPATNNPTTVKYDNTGVHDKQGLAINFMPSATVNNVTECVYEFDGCMDSTALNYQSLATVDDGSCWPVVAGCLDRNALNFNCTWPGVDARVLHFGPTSGRGSQLLRHPDSVTMAVPVTRSVPLVVSLLMAHIVSQPATTSPKTV